MFKQNVLSETSCIKGRCHLKGNSRTIYYIASGSLFLPVATNEISGGQLALGWPGKEQVVTEQKAQAVQVGAHRNPGSHSLAHSYLLPHHSWDTVLRKWEGSPFSGGASREGPTVRGNRHVLLEGQLMLSHNLTTTTTKIPLIKYRFWEALKCTFSYLKTKPDLKENGA